MRFKDWLPSKQQQLPDDQLTVDELMAIDRHEVAKARLLEKLRHNATDLHAHLKLADAYRHLGELESSREEYLHVAAAYAEDGFYDRARAVLTMASRHFPSEINVDHKMAALQRAKNLEYSRDKAREGLLSQSSLADTATGVKAVEFERVWNELSRTTLVDRISSHDVSRLFENVEIRKLAPNTVLADAAGTNSDPQPEALFIVVSGNVEARAADRNGRLITLRAFGPGEIVGDTVLFDHHPWAAQYRCSESATVLELSAAGAVRLFDGSPDVDGLRNILRDQGKDQIVRRAVDHLRR